MDSRWTPWLTVEERLLSDMWAAGASLEQIAEAMPTHSVGAIRSHRDRMKLLRAEGKKGQKVVKTWLRVIAALSGHSGMTMAEIEEAASISKGMCNRLVHEHHRQGLRIADWKIGPRKPSALWALGNEPDAAYPLVPVAQRIGARKAGQIRRATNPFTTAAGLVAAPTGGTGRVILNLIDFEEVEAA